MRIDKQTEEKLKVIVTKYLIKGRIGWDLPHTFTAVFWMRKLIENEGGDERILVTTMYLHDIGYPSLSEDNCNFEEVTSKKLDHMKIGAELTKKILKELNYSDEEIKKIAHLVSIHDNPEKWKGHDAILVMEADSLAQIDRGRVKPVFEKEDYEKFIVEFQENRMPYFKTKSGKKFLKELWPKCKGYYS